MLPVKCNHWRAAAVTGSAQNCLWHLVTSAWWQLSPSSYTLLPEFGSCFEMTEFVLKQAASGVWFLIKLLRSHPRWGHWIQVVCVKCAIIVNIRLLNSKTYYCLETLCDCAERLRLLLNDSHRWNQISPPHADTAVSCSWSWQRRVSSLIWSMPSGCSCRETSRWPLSSLMTLELKHSTRLVRCLPKTNRCEIKSPR